MRPRVPPLAGLRARASWMIQRDELRLVAPQGFTGIENKRDKLVFHSFPPSPSPHKK